MVLVSLKLYLVTCDLLQPCDYGSLKAKLQTLGARQVLDAQWALRTNYTAAQLKDTLRGSSTRGTGSWSPRSAGKSASRRARVSFGSSPMDTNVAPQQPGHL
jgi:hypothetical protein